MKRNAASISPSCFPSDRKFGAEGIGLCRTEHMFFASDRLPHVVAMIMARDEKERRKHLAKLLPFRSEVRRGRHWPVPHRAHVLRFRPPAARGRDDHGAR